MAAYDDLNIKRIFTVGIISIVVTAVTALAVQVMYFSLAQWQTEATSELSDYRRQNLILNEQAGEISEYGVDEETGNITIPIEQAIELVVGGRETDDESSAGAKHDDET